MHLLALFLQFLVASLFSPSFILSLSLLQSLPFFLRCPHRIYPFYLPPVFCAISSFRRLLLSLVSPGFLGYVKGRNPVRRSPMTHTYDVLCQWWSWVVWFAQWMSIFLRHTCPSPQCDIWSMPRMLEAAFHAWKTCLRVSHAARPHATPAGSTVHTVAMSF